MLKGEKTTLRALRLEDWKKTIKWRNDFMIKNLAMMHPFPITEMNELEWYEDLLKSKNDRTIYFAITNSNDEPLGFVFLNNINRTNRNCYLGIVIGDENSQGKGYGKDAMKTILNYAFNTLNLKKLTVEVVEKNTNAINLYTSLGFVKEGELKDQFFCESKYLTVYIYSIFNNVYNSN